MIYWPWLIAVFYAGAMLGFVLAAIMASARNGSEQVFPPHTTRPRMKSSPAFGNPRTVSFDGLKGSGL